MGIKQTKKNNTIDVEISLSSSVSLVEYLEPYKPPRVRLKEQREQYIRDVFRYEYNKQYCK
jgi:hypothetical protein